MVNDFKKLDPSLIQKLQAFNFLSEQGLHISKQEQQLLSHLFDLINSQQMGFNDFPQKLSNFYLEISNITGIPLWPRKKKYLYFMQYLFSYWTLVSHYPGNESHLLYINFRDKFQQNSIEKKIIDCFENFAFSPEKGMKLDFHSALSIQHNSIKTCLELSPNKSFLFKELYECDKDLFVIYISNSLTRYLSNMRPDTFRRVYENEKNLNFSSIKKDSPLALYKIYNAIQAGIDFYTKDYLEIKILRNKYPDIDFSEETNFNIKNFDIKKPLTLNEENFTIDLEITEQIKTQTAGENGLYGWKNRFDVALEVLNALFLGKKAILQYSPEEESSSLILKKDENLEFIDKNKIEYKTTKKGEKKLAYKESRGVYINAKSFPVGVSYHNKILPLYDADVHERNLKQLLKQMNKGKIPFSKNSFFGYAIPENSTLEIQHTPGKYEMRVYLPEGRKALEDLSKTKCYLNHKLVIHYCYRLLEQEKLNDFWNKKLSIDDSVDSSDNEQIQMETDDLDVLGIGSKCWIPRLYSRNIFKNFYDSSHKYSAYLDKYIKKKTQKIVKETGFNPAELLLERQLRLLRQANKLTPEKETKLRLEKQEQWHHSVKNRYLKKGKNSLLAIRTMHEHILLLAAVHCIFGFEYLNYKTFIDGRGRIYYRSLLSPTGSSLIRSIIFSNKKLNLSDIPRDVFSYLDFVNLSKNKEIQNMLKDPSFFQELENKLQNFRYDLAYINYIVNLASKEAIQDPDEKYEYFKQNFNQFIDFKFTEIDGGFNLDTTNLENYKKPILLLPFCLELVYNYINVGCDFDKLFENFQIRNFIQADACASGVQMYGVLSKNELIAKLTNILEANYSDSNQEDEPETDYNNDEDTTDKDKDEHVND